MPLDFASLVVRWQQQHGRQHLPWQGTRDPYRVWLSEIMLQQTQVSTVLGYYDRFLQRFPDVQALASAPADDVLALWSGLGYYSRARNLHRCAQAVVAEHGGQFPPSAQALAQVGHQPLLLRPQGNVDVLPGNHAPRAAALGLVAQQLLQRADPLLVRFGLVLRPLFGPLRFHDVL